MLPDIKRNPVPFLCLIFFFRPLFGIAQKSEFHFPPFENISTGQGLSNNNAWGIMQDSHGFIWVSTTYGLNRYDGYSFKTYNEKSIPSGWYLSLFEDPKGIIWTASSTQGFFSFDPRTGKVEHFDHESNNPNSLAGGIHNGNMLMDQKGLIWIGTQSGLNSFDPETKEFRLFRHQEMDSQSLSDDEILWICPDDENNLWLITGTHSLEVFNTASKKVTSRFAIGDPEMPGNKNEPALYAISKGRNGNIWIGSEENGLYGFNTKTQRWRHFYHQPANPFSLRKNGVNVCLEDEAGNLFVALIEKGLNYYDAATGQFHYTDIAGSNMADATITALLKDRSGKIWMTCSANGLFTIDPPHKRINSIQRVSHPIPSNSIYTFCETTHLGLMVTGHGGVYQFNKQSGRITPLEIPDQHHNLFVGNNTWRMMEDTDHTLWFCTHRGLIWFDPVTSRHNVYGQDAHSPYTISSSETTSIERDHQGRYWVTTFGAGLNRLDPASGNCKVYQAASEKNALPTNYLINTLKDSKGMMYIGTWYGGLICVNPATETMETFTHHPADPFSISGDNCIPLYEDPNGMIWIGTVGGGLNVYNPGTKKFRSFTMEDGLPSNAVVSLVNDNDGKTWLGTHHGLACLVLPAHPFDPEYKLDCRNYDTGDGLPSNDLSFLGAYKDREGTLFFSTANSGFFYFEPRDLSDNPFKPPVYITGLELMNKPVNAHRADSLLNLPIEFAKQIHLHYRQNILSFSFAALNFIHPEKNLYAYKLDGYDPDWIYTDASRRYATYTNLKPGNYAFMVKASNNDQLWNDDFTQIRISIKPPFWQTWWFKLLVVLSSMGFLLLVYRYRVTQLTRFQDMRNKIAADLHDDIGSTLTSISVFTEVARKEHVDRDHALFMIGESARRITESISDIVWSINPENDDFDKLLYRMHSLAHQLFKAKQIEYQFSADESLFTIKLPMEARRNFYLIFKEATNNLVKYSQALHVSISIRRERQGISCVISDDGVGFDSSLHYEGNGLANMKKRAAEIQALLQIESRIGQGTRIQLHLNL